MIQNYDRSKWIGASDTARVLGSWQTITFARWWAEKLGILRNTFSSPAMRAGSAYEHRILNFLDIASRDRQIRRRRLRLRVNLDGEDDVRIYEVKTYKGEQFRVSASYWQQCQVEMFAARKACSIVAYRMTEEEYQNYFAPLDKARISFHPIAYDAAWIETEYLPKLRYLAHCLQQKNTPSEQGLLAYQGRMHTPIVLRLFQKGE